MAQALGEKDAVPLLQENLKQEEAALAKLDQREVVMSPRGRWY